MANESLQVTNTNKEPELLFFFFQGGVLIVAHITHKACAIARFGTCPG